MKVWTVVLLLFLTGSHRPPLSFALLWQQLWPIGTTSLMDVLIKLARRHYIANGCLIIDHLYWWFNPWFIISLIWALESLEGFLFKNDVCDFNESHLPWLLTCLQRLTGDLNPLIRSYHLGRILKDTWLGFTLKILYLGRSN